MSFNSALYDGEPQNWHFFLFNKINHLASDNLPSEDKKLSSFPHAPSSQDVCYTMVAQYPEDQPQNIRPTIDQ